MISVQNLSDSYDRNVQIIRRQAEGLSHAESLIQLPFRGNCFNWIVGHIVANRNHVLRLVGGEPILDATQSQRYDRGSAPIVGPGEGVIELAQLLVLLDQSQHRLAGILGELSVADLSREIAFFGNSTMTIGEWLLFFFFHESYHTGQTEIMRQAAGKNDSII